jgi:hypothetical protein
MRPELGLALSIAQAVYAIHGSEFVITSVVEGEHKRASLHYTGCAADLRRPAIGAETLVARLTAALGDDFDVIFESDHIHVEFQPKAPY